MISKEKKIKFFKNLRKFSALNLRKAKVFKNFGKFDATPIIFDWLIDTIVYDR